MKPLLLLLLPAALLTACTDDAPARRPAASVATTSPAAAEPTTAAPDPVATTPAPATSGPPFPANTAEDTEQPTGGPLTVTAVRAARQDGYDRVVFELAGTEAGAPGWTVGYVDAPQQQGSGDEVQVAGEEVLQVLVTGVGYPFDTGQEEASADLTPRDTDRVREVDLQATFEGQFQAFIGLDQRVPFRVTRLADPARVVVDVRHS